MSGKYSCTIEHVEQTKDLWEGVLSGLLPSIILEKVGLKAGPAYFEVELQVDLSPEWDDDILSVGSEDGCIYAKHVNGKFVDISIELMKMKIYDVIIEAIDDSAQRWYADYAADAVGNRLEAASYRFDN